MWQNICWKQIWTRHWRYILDFYFKKSSIFICLFIWIWVKYASDVIFIIHFYQSVNQLFSSFFVASPCNMLGFQKDTVLLSILSVALTISLILTAFLICSIIKLRNKLCGRWTGKKSGSHSQQVSAKSGCASVINSHFDETAAVPLQRTAVNVSVDYHAQEVRA